jgi:hypothetical protein
MPRDLPTSFGAAAAAASISPVFLVELQWPTGTVRAWNGYGDITWGGNTFTGTGHLGTISPIKETRDGAANGVQLRLSGIPSGLIALALADDTQGRPAKIYFGLLNASAGFTIDPYLIFDGVIDICPIEDNGETASITINLEKELIDSRARGRRYTDEDLQIEYPGDLGLAYVAGLQNKEITWGKATVSIGGGAGSGVIDPRGGDTYE